MNGVNNQGQIVGAYLDSNGIEHGFVYSGGVFTALADPLGTTGTDAYGINLTGQIVGKYSDSSHVLHGFHLV